MPESAERTFVAEPELPPSATASALDPEARRDLRGLQKDTAERVAQHLVAAGMLVDEDPERALEHARYARRRAARIAVVREAAGIVAYRAGEWNEALGEFRAARRMGGGPGHVPVMADIERALGRPERALDLARGPESRDLGEADRIELLIVAAGARRDLGEVDASVVALQVPELQASRRDPWSARLFYAYADNLLAADRRSEAVQWFVHAYDADTEQETDAAARIAELTGDLPPGAEAEDDFVVGEVELSAEEIAELAAAAESEEDEPGAEAQVDEELDADETGPGTDSAPDPGGAEEAVATVNAEPAPAAATGTETVGAPAENDAAEAPAVDDTEDGPAVQDSAPVSTADVESGVETGADPDVVDDAPASDPEDAGRDDRTADRGE